MSDSNGLMTLLGTLFFVGLISLAVFLILREMMCWYWKINEGLSVLREIQSSLDSLRHQVSTVASAQAGVPVSSTSAEEGPSTCTKCGRLMGEGDRYCEACGARN